MSALRILENCSIASRGFKRGEVVAVGADLSAEEAGALLKWRRAEACEVTPTPEKTPDENPAAEKPAGEKLRTVRRKAE